MLQINTKRVARRAFINHPWSMITLEDCFWNALDEICKREDCTLRDLIAHVEQIKDDTAPYTVALRRFAQTYWRNIAALSGNTVFENRSLRDGLAGK